MYRYTAKKNKQANQKFQQKQLNKKNSRKTTTKSREVTKTEKTSRQSSTRGNKTPKRQSQTTKQPKRSLSISASSNLRQWLKTLGSILVVLILLAAIFLISFNSFLPQFFNLDEEVNLLLVGSKIDEQAEQLYLVKVLPETSTVTVLSLRGDLMVPITGGYGKYPLGSLAPFLNFENNNLSEVRSAYNYSLKQVIDEVYFVPGLEPIKTKKELQAEIGRLMKDELVRTTKIRKEVLDLFFEIKTSQYFAERELTEIDDEVGTGVDLGVSREKLVNCPVVLINAAGVNGLARKISQMVETNGFSVVNWETSSEILGQSRIYYDQNEPDCLKVVQAVQKIFPKIAEIIPDGGEQAQKNRAKAVIILGSEISD